MGGGYPCLQLSPSMNPQDSTQRLWVGSNRRGPFASTAKPLLLPRSTCKTAISNNPDGFPVTTILEDSRKTLVGTFDWGLKRINFKDGIVTHYRYDPNEITSLGNNLILCLYEDTSGVLWVGTHGGGFSCSKPDTLNFTNFTENDGLPNNVIYGILEDETGNLWISTNFGISRFNPATETFRNFTVSDGLQSNEFNQSAYAVDSNGTMYFGGINGSTSFQLGVKIMDDPSATYSPHPSRSMAPRSKTKQYARIYANHRP